MALSFDRVALRLVLQTIKHRLVEDVFFPSSGIYLNAPADIYVNTRTNGTDLEQNTYPRLAIYPVSSRALHSHNYPDVQQSSTTSTGDVLVYDSDLVMETTLNFELETSTTWDYLKYSQIIDAFFQKNRTGFTIYQDVLPIASGSVNLLAYTSSEHPDIMPKTRITPAKCVYRVYKETLEKLFIYYTISGVVDYDLAIDGDYTNNSDQLESWWSSTTGGV